ncbi:MAG: hypothetical protein RIS44_2339 [Pseudomonadota bacterium]|jgi:hypothetical protein
MKLNKVLSALAVAGATVFGGAAHAVPTITNLDGTLSPFGGFDWASGAAAWSVGFAPVPGTVFTTYYAAWAVALNETGSGTLWTPRLDTNANGVPAAAGVYEYTIFASFTETVLGCVPGACTFSTGTGTFDIYYDTAANARQSNGTGFQDGTLIISGDINGAAAPNVFNSVTGGSQTFEGTVTYTNAAYISPLLVGSNLSSTLQLGAGLTGFTVPTGYNGVAFAPGTIVFQADANQAFNTVPEPTSLLMAGIALAACGIATRRRNKAA